MASELQIEANRRNAQRSTGPQTLEGKAAVRLNALKHGLTAQEVVIPGEDEDQFDEVLKSYVDHYQPVGPPETLLVQQVVMAAWRLTRGEGAPTLLARYEARDERSFYRARHELQRLLAARPPVAGFHCTRDVR